MTSGREVAIKFIQIWLYRKLNRSSKTWLMGNQSQKFKLNDCIYIWFYDILSYLMILYDVVWYYIILITHYIYSSLVFIITNLGSPQLGAQCFFPSAVYDLLLGILLGTIQRAPAIWLSTTNGYGLLYNHGKMTITITIYGWYIYIYGKDPQYGIIW